MVNILFGGCMFALPFLPCNILLFNHDIYFVISIFKINNQLFGYLYIKTTFYCNELIQSFVVFHSALLDFSSPEPKAQVSFSDQNLCVVRRRCRKLFIFFSRTTGPVSTKLETTYSWVKRIQISSNEWSHPFPRGDNYEKAKIH